VGLGPRTKLRGRRILNVCLQYNHYVKSLIFNIGAAESVRGNRNACKVLVDKPEGKKPLLWSSGQSS
jgi:hypothetical protein